MICRWFADEALFGLPPVTRRCNLDSTSGQLFSCRATRVMALIHSGLYRPPADLAPGCDALRLS
jgi:hypothetical protein